MGLWCTVFGHDWGEPETERDRREEGKEVVVTVREVRICDRCGAEEVLGESVEVTAIEPARTGQSGDREHETGSTHDGASPPGDDPEAERYDDPATDDGVVLEGSDHDVTGSAARSRQPGEWPDRPEREGADSGRDREPRPWPDPEIERQRETESEKGNWVDTLPGDETEASEGSAGERPTGERPTGKRPTGEESDGKQATGGDLPGYGPGTGEPDEGAAEPDDWDSPVGGVFPGERPEDDAEVLDATEPNEQTQVTAADPADPASESVDSASESADPLFDSGGSGDEPERAHGACYCPECGFVHDQSNPSFRGGDVCPNCRQSYLAEREE